MGQAFHRKRISLDRSLVRRGTGIRYLDADWRDRELTAEEIAAREEGAQQQRIRKEQRQSGVNTLLEIAREILDDWKQAMDENDQRVIAFAGWTTADYCALPVDEEVARFYVETIHQWQRQADRPLSLEELDRIFGQGLERRIPTDQVVEKAMQIIRPLAQKCTDAADIALARFADLLSKRSWRARQLNIDLDSALEVVSEQMALMSEKLEVER